jgi:predicted Zn-dependent protease
VASPPPEPEEAAEYEDEYEEGDDEVSWTPLSGSESLEELVTLTTREPDNPYARQAIYGHLGEDPPRLVQVYRALATDYGDEDPYHVLNLARAYVHTGSDSLAVLQLRKYVKNEPTAEGYQELGEVYERMGKGELAQQAFKKAEQLS